MANEKRNEMLKQLSDCNQEYNGLCARLGHSFFQGLINQQLSEDIKAEGKALVKKVRNLESNLPKEEAEEIKDGSPGSEAQAKAG